MFFWRLLIALALLIGASPNASAHDLEVDQLRIWLAPGEHKLTGQLSFDPELTRKLDAKLSPARAEQRVLAFVRAELTATLDGKPLGLHWTLRELYVIGGAVPGDLVMLESDALAESPGKLEIKIGPSFKTLLVAVGGTAANDGMLLHGGESTPPLTLHAPAPVPSVTASPRESASPAEAPAQGYWSTFTHYVAFGFHHILPGGWDHVLFVCGLVLGSRGRMRRLMLELLAFTLAHTLTLGLGAAGWVVVPARIVEPLIALSISYVAVENLLRPTPSRARVWVILGFGLLHGQGFARALSETPLPPRTFLTALFSFNLGVELGQLAVVAALAAVLYFIKKPEALTRYAVRPASLAIALVGLYWGVTRLIG